MHFKLSAIVIICVLWVDGRTENPLGEFNNSSLAMSQNLSTNKTDLMENSSILNNSTTVKNHTIPIIKRPNMIKRMRHRKKKRLNTTINQQVNKNTTISNNKMLVSARKRKRKRLRKNKQRDDNILEISTARSKSSIKINESAMVDLIQAINKNPESNNLLNQSNIKRPKRKRCGKNNGGCSQICNRKGKKKCSCHPGYFLAKNHKLCIDLDECKFKNGGCMKTCHNIPGAHFCSCPPGFRLGHDLAGCEDINECLLRNGHGPCQDTCTNTHGSYICDCSHLNGTRLAKDKHTCRDIDECDEGNWGCSHTCINTIGTAFCTCPDGMQLITDDKTCQDVDECADESIRQSCKHGCMNTMGSYYCEADLQNDQAIWKFPVCSPLNPPLLGYFKCLRSNWSIYDSFTKNGRKRIRNSPGTKCKLICPIGYKLSGDGKVFCGADGQWKMRNRQFCIEASNPRIKCPLDQTVSLEKNEQVVDVNFEKPLVNVPWNYVKSIPEWCQNLKGQLPLGHHTIIFFVTDPITKLSSNCSFSITVQK